MKVHITLKKEARSADSVSHVVEAGGLQNVNEPRARRWGIITAEIEPQNIEKIETLPQVEAVEVDSEKRTA